MPRPIREALAGLGLLAALIVFPISIMWWACAATAHNLDEYRDAGPTAKGKER